MVSLADSLYHRLQLRYPFGIMTGVYGMEIGAQELAGLTEEIWLVLTTFA